MDDINGKVDLEFIKKMLNNTETFLTNRLSFGEAWMVCSDCGSKLYSFDGSQDLSRKCPNMDRGKCNYPVKS